jgi:mersacidin/lichenicidin family type 2 lantibiotic
MNNIDIIRAWKDAEYRQSLTSDELKQLPANPVGEVELSESDLAQVVGGSTGGIVCSLLLCQSVLICSQGC